MYAFSVLFLLRGRSGFGEGDESKSVCTVCVCGYTCVFYLFPLAGSLIIMIF